MTHQCSPATISCTLCNVCNLCFTGEAQYNNAKLCFIILSCISEVTQQHHYITIHVLRHNYYITIDMFLFYYHSLLIILMETYSTITTTTLENTISDSIPSHTLHDLIACHPIHNTLLLYTNIVHFYPKDQYANSLMHDQNMTLYVPIHRMVTHTHTHLNTLI